MPSFPQCEIRVRESGESVPPPRISPSSTQPPFCGDFGKKFWCRWGIERRLKIASPLRPAAQASRHSRPQPGLQARPFSPMNQIAQAGLPARLRAAGSQAKVAKPAWVCISSSRVPYQLGKHNAIPSTALSHLLQTQAIDLQSGGK